LKKNLFEKLVKVQEACHKYFGNKTKTMPWQVQDIKGAMEEHMDGKVVGESYCASVEWGFIILIFQNSDNHGKKDLLLWIMNLWIL
jgi:hypothetical protein